MSATGETSPRPRQDRGFTLVEALVVVAVTALVGALLFPAVDRSLARLSAMQAQTALRVELAAARARASRLDTPVRLEVDADARGYVATGGVHRPLPTGLTLAVSAPPVFFPDGSSTGGRLRLSGPGAPRGVTAIDPVSGLAGTEAATAPAPASAAVAEADEP